MTPKDPRITQDQINRFWAKVDKTPGLGLKGECWEWTAGQKNKEGYGGFYLWQINNTINCHKFVFMVVHNFKIGEIPKDIVIRHLCNNHRCVNPDHLAIGTHKDNSQDMVMAGHSQAGEKNSKAKLTEEKVVEIRRLWAVGNQHKSSLARMFSVTPAVIHQVLTNFTWKDPTYIPPEFPPEKLRGYKFSDQIIAEIRDLRKAGVPVKELVVKYAISTSQVYNIIRGDQRKGGVV